MRFVVVALSAALASCGGSSPSAPAPPPSTGPTIIITASGVNPRELTVSPGARVLFRNDDARSHDMASDEHPAHLDCTEINQVGLLAPGQSRETLNLVTVRTCGFHDHDNPTDVRLQGRITIR